MKKKGPRSIPDFSRKPQGRPTTPLPDADHSATQKPRDLVVKPKTTSSKSGRRGQ